MFALLPAIDLGIFVTTILLSMVTVEVTPVGKDAGVDEEGTVKSFGSQSSIKKPIVGASVGSTCGLTVVVSIGVGGIGGGAGVLFFSQEEKVATIKKAFAIKEIRAFEIIGDLFNCNKVLILKICCRPKNRPATFVLQIAAC